MRFEFGDVDGVSRPFLDFRLFDDPVGVVTRGLVDTESTHTVLPAGFSTAFADTAPQRRISTLAGALAAAKLHVPVGYLDMLALQRSSAV